MKTRIDFKEARIAGVTGTILFHLVGLIFTGQWLDIPSLLGSKTGLGTELVETLF